MTRVIHQMSKDKTFLEELHTVRLICFDIYNAYMLDKVRELDPETYLNLFQNFDLHYQILDRMGVPERAATCGELLQWYTEQVDKVCSLYAQNPGLDVKMRAAAIYSQLKDKTK